MHQEDPPPDSDHHSALVTELKSMPARVRGVIGIPDVALDMLDGVAATLYEVLDDTTAQSWEDRLQRLVGRFEKIFPDGLPEEKLNKLGSLSEEQMTAEFTRQFAKFQNGSRQRFLNQLLGSKRFHRLKIAFEQDWALCLLGSRRLLRGVMPIAQALEDAVIPLSKSEREDLAALNETETVFLNVTLQLDRLIGAFFDKREMNLEGMGFPVRDAEATTLDLDLEELATAMRVILDVEAQRRAGELSDVLLRKLRGFEQALANSEDGVSQAASSLVEFIDRLLRTAFTNEEVLAWVMEHRPDDKLMTFERADVILPTKRASAMCFAYAGQAPAENSTLEAMVALSLVKVRASAEKLKHADRGTPEEEAELRRMMRAMRGSITFIIRFSWLLGDDSRYQSLQRRFARAA
jgi:hypothetical protein